MVRTVYLDQWVWIELSRVHYGRSNEWETAYDAVLKAREQASAVFPLSLSHLRETAVRRDDGSRGRLLDFMSEIADAYAIRPWSYMLEPEAKNAVRILMDETPRDLRSVVFGRGIGHLLGTGQPRLVPTVPDPEPLTREQQRKLDEALAEVDRLANLKDPRFAETIRRATALEEDFTKKLQAMVDRDYNHPDKSRRQEIAEGRFMLTVVADPLCQAMDDLSPEPKELMKESMASKENIRAILRNMPTYHTYFVLNNARNLNRPVKSNDLWDWALNIAIPYCDIVATEREWCNVAAQNDLDDLRGTSLVHSPSGLVEAMEVSGGVADP